MLAKRLIVVESQETATSLAVPWFGNGFGLLLCEEPDGARCTLTCSLEYAHLIAEAGDEGGIVTGELDLPLHKFPLRREGWPEVERWARGTGRLR